MTPEESMEIAREALRREGGYLSNVIDILKERGQLEPERESAPPTGKRAIWHRPGTGRRRKRATFVPKFGL